ncbi:hypothetical protein [Vibrio litoralis]|uniref:hypothetical protein n=1 Tax=Vibrio litoralis TaxID=335972 RepID=UPI001868806C|nr:hypothetical protein [Vibrio litoralis]
MIPEPFFTVDEIAMRTAGITTDDVSNLKEYLSNNYANDLTLDKELNVLANIFRYQISEIDLALFEIEMSIVEDLELTQKMLIAKENEFKLLNYIELGLLNSIGQRSDINLVLRKDLIQWADEQNITLWFSDSPQVSEIQTSNPKKTTKSKERQCKIITFAFGLYHNNKSNPEYDFSSAAQWAKMVLDYSHRVDEWKEKEPLSHDRLTRLLSPYFKELNII